MEILRELYRNFAQLFVWWVVVSPWEQIVRVRLGKHVRVFGAGVHLRLPFADVIYRQTVRRRVLATTVQTISTRDQKVITVGGQLSYVIDDLARLYLTLHHAQQVINSACQALVSEFIVGHDSTDCTPERVQEHVRKGLSLSEYGIGGVEYFITNFAIARTHRLITGEIYSWTDGDSLRTDNPEAGLPIQAGPHP